MNGGFYILMFFFYVLKLSKARSPVGRLTHTMHTHQHKFYRCFLPQSSPSNPVRTITASLGSSRQTMDCRGCEKPAKLNYGDIQEGCNGLLCYQDELSSLR